MILEIIARIHCLRWCSAEHTYKKRATSQKCKPVLVSLVTMVGDAECPQKKRKRVRKRSNHIHFLPDELLLEILFRLPCCKSAIQCKSVCKRWAALIPSPFFIARFITDKKKRELEVFCSVLRVYPSRINKDTWRGLAMYLRDPFFNLNSLSFSSLPSFKGGNATAFTVHALCNDLLFYCRYEFGEQNFYICNVQTEQWLSLPTLPFYCKCFSVAFSCDPYYSFGKEKDYGGSDIIFNPVYRYSIVVVPYKARWQAMMHAYLFSRNNHGVSQWREIVLLLPQPCLLIGVTAATGFVFDGKLHFICCEGIIGFDPYDDDGNNSGIFKCHVIDWPYGTKLGGHYIGECQGRLYLLLFAGDWRLLIWCLRDYETSEWSLEHNIARQEWIIQNDCISRYIEKDSRLLPRLGRLIAIHPTDPDVVYLLFPCWIVLCKLSARTLQIASPAAARAAGLIPCCFSFQSVLPVWPTPLPTLS